MLAKGEFTSNIQPLKSHFTGQEGMILSRMSIEKTFRGDLKGISNGEMLAAMTPIEGSAGYVALEQVSGNLHGRSGSFILQHFGTMQQEKDFHILKIVPDSGSGELTGINGNMEIEISGEDHFYKLEYQLNVVNS